MGNVKEYEGDMKKYEGTRAYDVIPSLLLS